MGLHSFDLIALQTSGADVIGTSFAVFHKGDLLNVCVERSLGFTIGMADIVSGNGAFTANTANSRHIEHLHG